MLYSEFNIILDIFSKCKLRHASSYKNDINTGSTQHTNHCQLSSVGVYHVE